MSRNQWINLSKKLIALHGEMLLLRTELEELTGKLEQDMIDSENTYIESLLDKDQYMIYRQKADQWEIADEASDTIEEACDCVDDVVANLELLLE